MSARIDRPHSPGARALVARLRAPLLIAACAAFGAAAAFAQTAAPAAGERVSLLRIFLDGIEAPSYLIFAGSMAAIAIIIEHFVSVRRAMIAPGEQVKRAHACIESRAFRECVDALRGSKTYFAQVMSAALAHARHGFDAMHEAALERASQLNGHYFRRAEYLNIIGNLGPLLGLLGTVWGMIEAFGSLGAGGGQAGAGDLASGISKALVNTGLGLTLAIMGIGFYGVCRNRIDALTTAATVSALDLIEYFRPSALAKAAPDRPAETARA